MDAVSTWRVILCLALEDGWLMKGRVTTVGDEMRVSLGAGLRQERASRHHVPIREIQRCTSEGLCLLFVVCAGVRTVRLERKR